MNLEHLFMYDDLPYNFIFIYLLILYFRCLFISDTCIHWYLHKSLAIPCYNHTRPHTLGDWNYWLVLLFCCKIQFSIYGIVLYILSVCLLSNTCIHRYFHNIAMKPIILFVYFFNIFRWYVSHFLLVDDFCLLLVLAYLFTRARAQKPDVK